MPIDVRKSVNMVQINVDKIDLGVTVYVSVRLTHYIEAAIQLADSVSSPTLAHLPDLRPLVEVWVKPLHAGQ